METRENNMRVANGWVMVAVLLAAGGLLVYAGYWVIPSQKLIPIVAWGLVTLFWLTLIFGFFALQPNIAGVMTLFGQYRGTVTTPGLNWANPLFLIARVSLRAHNLNAERIKVNDLRGSPIEIAAVVVWKVIDTARAVFDVESHESFVKVQIEAALRHLAMSYPYDTFEGDTISLRGSVDEVSATLKREVQDRVIRAGVSVEEAKISHLAYAPEVAGAMLQRQQAEAVVAARSRIVEGAVGMVEMALAKLEQHKIVELDDERKAAMISNLLVVLCAHSPAQPIVNAGTLYT
ncbi:MAG: SPFH domain-containing protein [Planctomycetota bacterium]